MKRRGALLVLVLGLGACSEEDPDVAARAAYADQLCVIADTAAQDVIFIGSEARAAFSRDTSEEVGFVQQFRELQQVLSSLSDSFDDYADELQSLGVIPGTESETFDDEATLIRERARILFVASQAMAGTDLGAADGATIEALEAGVAALSDAIGDLPDVQSSAATLRDAIDDSDVCQAAGARLSDALQQPEAATTNE